jgi:hypothetical protein
MSALRRLRRQSPPRPLLRCGDAGGAPGVEVSGIDLDTKQVVAVFPTAEVREQSFEAIRGRGYTVVPRSA